MEEKTEFPPFEPLLLIPPLPPLPTVIGIAVFAEIEKAVPVKKPPAPPPPA
jgi:hypothetical protein